jgi:small conductance mechanosensitive channel
MVDAVTEFFSDVWTDYSFEFLASVGVIVGTLVVLWLIRRWIRKWHRKALDPMAASDVPHERERAQRLVTLADVVKVAGMIIVWSIAVLTVMALWGVPMAPFLAVGTTIGVAVGFGAQNVIRDIIAGFLIVLEDQYSVGDVVNIAGASGTVEVITLRTTVLRDLNGDVHHVPNGQIRVASNMTSAFARYVADIPISYDADVGAAMDIILTTANRMVDDPRWTEAFLEEPEMLGVNDLGDSSVTIRLLLTVVTEERWAVKREFLKRVKRGLDEGGIEIPYSYLNVVVRDGDPKA